MSVPSFQEQPLSCKCGHEWINHMPVHVRIEILSAAIKAMRCPACGGGPRKIMFGHTPKQVEVQTGKSIEQRVGEWRLSRDTGLSSEAMAFALSGADLGGRELNYPHDPADLGRCLRLLRVVPEWRDRILTMGGAGVVWAALAARWAELEQSMADEVGIFWEKGGAAPKTYDLMREIIEGARV